jgi:hypothetical protein
MSTESSSLVKCPFPPYSIARLLQTLTKVEYGSLSRLLSYPPDGQAISYLVSPSGVQKASEGI